MAARMPMMAMTVRISMRVKPDDFRVCIFIEWPSDSGVGDVQINIRKLPRSASKNRQVF